MDRVSNYKINQKRHSRMVWFSTKLSTITFGYKVNNYTIRDFCDAINFFTKSGGQNLTLNFSNVIKAYPNGMLPVITTINKLRHEGIEIYVLLPKDDNTRKLFRSVNWAHYLSPKQFGISESTHDRHLVTRNFNNLDEQQNVVNDFMDMILRNMEVPRDIISALEWSINEITDNVLNHSHCQLGGFVQASTYRKNNSIAFAVADSGVGILNSLKEGIPTLRTDLQAIGEAIKEGVTRGKQYGQGNGLAGSLRVTTMTGGSFDITSGKGRLVVTPDETKRKEFKHSSFGGTLVSGEITISENFSAVEALSFGNDSVYSNVDIIESLYEMDEEDSLLLKMKEETTGFGTRRSGVQIRTKIINLLNAEQTYPLVIDWSGVPVISSSFADEVMGKLFLKMGALTFSARIRNKGMEELIVKLIDKAISQRLTQEKDD